MPTPYRPQTPPEELIHRGKARLLAELSAIVADSSEAIEPPDSLTLSNDRYEFGEVVATGGLGVVRRGEDRRLGRPVAIKELLRDSPEAARRFALEAAITARLQHPGIVPLYDLGWLGEGKPFYCMQLVDGDSLEARIAAAEELSARLRLIEHVIAVADAIAYAHERQIIHRDIKPANVLVGRFGETVVIDWGLAKDLSGTLVATLDQSSVEPSRDGVSDMTQAGTVMGTLRYMAPEQAQGEAVDPRSDVYSLGALLHHVLAGEPPFAGGEREELIHRVLAGKLRPLADIDPAIPRELAAIVERAMATDPNRRYPSAAAFAEDLRSFQAGRRVSAHSYSPSQVLGRWVRRHRVVVGASLLTIAAITLVGGAAIAKVRAERALAAGEAERAERLAFEQSVVTEARRASEVLMLAQTPGRELQAIALGTEVVAPYGPDYEQAPDLAIAGVSRAFAGVIPMASLHHAVLIQASADGSRLATVTSTDTPELQLWSLEPAMKLIAIPLTKPGFRAEDLAISPDNQLLAVADQRRCLIFDAATGERPLEIEDCASPSFAADGRTLYGKLPAAQVHGRQLYEGLAAWDLPSGAQRWSTPTPGENFVIIVHPDGRRVIVRNDHLAGETVEIIAAPTGELEATLARSTAQPRRYWERSPAFAWPEHVALSPDGRTLAVSETDEDGRIVLWDLESERAEVLELAGGIASTPVFSADGARLLVGGFPIRAYDLQSHALLSSLPMSGFAVGLARDGLAIADGRWIELPRGRSTQATPAERLRRAVATPDGRFVITVADDRTRIWSTDDHLALERWTPPLGETIAEYGGDQILTTDEAGVWRIHARRDRSRPPVLVDPELARAEVLARAAERPSLVVLASADGVEVRELATGELRCAVAIPSSRWKPALSDSGDRVVIVDERGRGHLWEVEGCRERTVLPLHDPAEESSSHLLLSVPEPPLRFAADGSLIIQLAGRITRVDLDGRATDLERACVGSVLSPDARVLLSACGAGYRGHAAQLREVEGDKLIASLDLRRYATRPWFSSDGRLLIFGAGSRELAIVNVADGRELLRVPTAELPASFVGLRVRPDQPIVDVVTVDGQLRSYPITRAQLIGAACEVLGNTAVAALRCPGETRGFGKLPRPEPF